MIQQLHFHPISDEHKYERHGDGSEIQQADGRFPFSFSLRTTMFTISTKEQESSDT